MSSTTDALIGDTTSPPTTPIPLPLSPLYQLLTTPGSGRGVFASTAIPADTLILDSASKPTSIQSKLSCPNTQTVPVDASPLAWLIQRPYRKEACATCFAYNRGREWKLKVLDADCGVVFCSEPCRESWSTKNGEVGVQAWASLEAGVKAILKRDANGGKADVEMRDVDEDRSHDSNGSEGMERGPSDEEIAREWGTASLIGEVVLNMRSKEKPSKNERKVMRNVVERGGDPDLMYYLLTAVIAAYNAAQSMEEDTEADQHGEQQKQVTSSAGFNADTNGVLDGLANALVDTNGTATSSSLSKSASTLIDITPPSSSPSTSNSSKTMSDQSTLSATLLLSPLFHLTPTNTAYEAAHTSLDLYTSSYLFLLTIIPLPLTPYLTPVLAHNFNVRAAWNAFSIRPASQTSTKTNNTSKSDIQGTSDGPDSGEFLGYAVYPSASFFNHSCAPNLWKQRTGRVFEFYAARNIDPGEELCISYLGGEEETLDLKERRMRLKDEWGFTCQCGKCVRDSGDKSGV